MNEKLTDKLAALPPEKRLQLLEAIKKKKAGEAAEAAEPAPARARTGEAIPLSFTQQRLWFLQELDPHSPFYNIPSAFRLFGEWEEGLLSESLMEMTRRHEVLRTSFRLGDEGRPVQIVAPSPKVTLRSVDLRTWPEEVRLAEAERIVSNDVQRPCDLRIGPLWWATLIRLEDQEYRLVFTMHHIIFDGWSLGVFIRELSSIYDTLLSGGELSALPQPATQYADYVYAQRERASQELQQRQLAYWKDHLAGGLPVLELPADRPRPPVQTFRGSMHTLVLPRELYDALKSYSREHEATLFMTLLSLFKVLLYRYTGVSDIIVGFPISGRHLPHTEHAIGVFVNTLPLRTGISGDQTFADLLGEVRKTALSAYENQDVPFDRLVEAIKPDRNLSHNPLFQVLFTYQNALPPIRTGDRSITYEAIDGGTSKFDLSLDIFEGPDGPTCIFEYNTDLYDRDRIVRMAEHFQVLAEAVAGGESCRIAELPLLGAAERERMLTDWNRTSRPYERVAAIHHLFERQAARLPNGTAVTMEGESLTYRELDVRANGIALKLQEMGIAQGSRVGICVERSLDMIAGVLAILKAGGAYVPVDPDYPAERIAYMVEDAQLSVMLTQQVLADRFAGGGLALFLLDAEQTATPGEETRRLTQPDTKDEDLAYLIYTSGTTGQPKGTMVSHASLVNAYFGWEEAYRLKTDAKVHLQLASFSFDVFTGDWVRALCSGAKLVLLKKDTMLDAPRLLELMKKERVDAAEFVPAVFRNLIRYLETTGQKLDFMRVLCIGSDRWYVHEYKHYRRFCGPDTRLINSYGLTEATIDSTYFEGDAASMSPNQLIPIGRPFPNQQAYVLDADQQPVPVGVPGELYIGGRGLARGYWNRPALTAERFIPHPIPGHEGMLVYRTGDRAKYLPDGNIELLDRMDNQVKLRGYRIELGEIETALIRDSSVKECVVQVWENRMLAAWVVPETGMSINTDRLRSAVKLSLPDYMVPASFVVMEELPLTANGKIDRAALPAPTLQSEDDGSYAAPRTLIEEKLACVWAELFQVRRMGIHSDFFVNGGHSLLAIQLIASIREAFRVDLTLQVLFQAPTIAELAAVIAEKSGQQQYYQEAVQALPELQKDPEGRHDPFPLTEVQQAYWIGRNEAFEMGNVSTHSYDELEVEHIDPARFQLAWNRLVQRHDMLRAIVTEDGMQQVLEQVPEYEITVLDLRGHSAESTESALAALRESMSHQMLETDRWPVFDLRLTLLDHSRARIHLSSDALIFDAWSYVILLKELSKLHQNPEAELPELELTFRDYVHAEARMKETDAYLRSLAYWKERIPSLPPAPELPMAKSPGSLKNPYFSRLHNRLDPDVWSRLKAKATRMGLTASGVLLSAYAEVLAAWSKNHSFCLNLTFLNRLQIHPQVHDIVGEFTSLTLLEIDHAAGISFVDRAGKTQQKLWNDLEHHHVSGVHVLRELSRAQGGVTRALMPVVFTSALTLPIPDRASSGFDLKPFYSITQTSQVWLDCGVWEDEKVLYCNWDVVRELFPEGMLEEMFAAYFGLLHRLANEDDVWHEGWVIRAGREAASGASQEGQAVIAAVSDTAVESSDLAAVSDAMPAEEAYSDRAASSCKTNPLLHELFCEQARRDPKQAAIATSEFEITYGELNRVSSRYARQLRKNGAAPNRLVAVVMEKGWEQAAAVLAVLKSGAAYLPIDPDTPKERMQYLLQQGQVGIVLTQPWLEAKLDWLGEDMVMVALDYDGLAGLQDGPLESLQRPEDLAYVIYTSGSTGKPKGVMIHHLGAVNTVLDMNERFSMSSSDRVLALSALSFDLSVYDLFGTLAAGGTIIIPDSEHRKDPAHWLYMMRKERVTIWNSVPALMNMLVEFASSQRERLNKSLRLVLMSGDWIPLALPDAIRALCEDVELISLGGATEASIWSILYPIGEVDPAWSSIPYGKAMRNQTMHVLNEAMEPCPTWVSGQLYIGGTGLAQGYYGDEEKTAASFVVHPRTGERLYRTGDLGRWLPDGNIEFMGREDFQVKIQGYRIELGEIEAALAQHPHIREAVATVAGEGNRQRLAAYLVLHQDGAMDQEEIRGYLANKLPDYMIPSYFMVLDALPLTANGKVNRKELPVVELAEIACSAEAVPPRTEMEERIASIWRELLNLESVSVFDNFFELGGDSLLAVRLMVRLQADTGCPQPLRVLFEQPTIAGLAARMRTWDEQPVASLS
ncbi:amino acid adenylation domain-containing protein [Paenibacillus pinisoli]|uniref:Phenyloxazoline synthase MbtB n=1 Tax=Paenibacillus pinisoli TaxID=1276110 RepID=A0A3A6PR69_9BACL|nr:non-ribosomal peptide synthetase [Paenibacillus pinisoli]RJX39161.1 amino acid adenylation domain-containing protein [Paenibacillus pinisoli]